MESTQASAWVTAEISFLSCYGLRRRLRRITPWEPARRGILSESAGSHQMLPANIMQDATGTPLTLWGWRSRQFLHMTAFEERYCQRGTSMFYRLKYVE